MPFIKGNAIGKETRFKTGESGNPAGRPADRLHKRIEAELEKIVSSAPARQDHVLAGCRIQPGRGASQ
jgi:hypothetical protein